MSRAADREALPQKVFDTPVTRQARVRIYDRVFFFLGTLGAVWLVIVLAATAPSLSWASVVVLVLLWGVLAYLALPRLNRMMAAIYVPGYFIGRTRTSDGLLGDPLNMAVRGTGKQLATAMHKAGWILADPVTLGSSIEIVRSTLTRRPVLAHAPRLAAAWRCLCRLARRRHLRPSGGAVVVHPPDHPQDRRRHRRRARLHHRYRHPGRSGRHGRCAA